MKIFSVLFLVTVIALLSGCQSTADMVSDVFGDAATAGSAVVQVIKVTPSDPANNNFPTVKEVVVIGDINSIPLKASGKEQLKDFVKMTTTRTPSWYNKENVTERKELVVTASNNAELQKILDVVVLNFFSENRAEVAKALSEKVGKTDSSAIIGVEKTTRSK